MYNLFRQLFLPLLIRAAISLKTRRRWMITHLPHTDTTKSRSQTFLMDGNLPQMPAFGVGSPSSAASFSDSLISRNCGRR
ncbi:uncharacterized protein EDB91DRAFT_1176524 [Suillus paluster]|uniref:uncharacterized protein n=1 Tax=Suillus paluster TaxID=48578 RepID=UPI001B880205|nr:uncharacterized protein EDB91DRAFT_1176524 [Suillus paluster]KAG1721231.1 hypothetical protein EDB91DRAFT_1176524 [Suillus paluster]